MSVVLRVGAVQSDYYAKDSGCTDVESYDDCSAPEDYVRPSCQSFPGCFGLPYQDHNYGAPPPASPPPHIPSPSTFVDKINGHIEVEEVSVSCIGQQASVDVTSDPVDDSITRCICDFTHDDGFMICCDKCSVWQHIDCMAVDRANIPDSYFCELCEPRPLDRERARQIQLRKREFILAADSSTDTDPEEPANRRLSQDLGNKKTKTKKRMKILKGKDEKNKNSKKDKKDIKKEKENKDLSKKLRISLKDSSTKKNGKNKVGKKSGLLSLVINENAQQDPWDSTHSPWVDKYEEVVENQYSADMQAILGLKKLNGSVNYSGNFDYKRNGRLLVQLCHVTEVNKNRKGLEASETIGEGEPIIEYTGNVMLREQFDKANFYKRLNPFVLFNSMFDNIELCIDATMYGNIARFIRRSCKSNAEVRHTFEDGELTFIVVSTKVIPRGSEITIPYDYNYKECTYCVECACLRNNCPVAKYFKKKQNAQNKRDKVVPKNSVKTVKSPKVMNTATKPVLNHQPKSPRSPAASLPRSPMKSPIRRSISVEEPVVKEEPVEIKPEVPPLPPPPDVSPVKEIQEERTEEVKEQEVVPEQSTDSGTDHQDTLSESEDNPSTERTRRLSREDRKMEAIMKAFEKMEKRQERRKEALARIEHVKKPTTNTRISEEPKKEKTKAKPQQEPKETRRTSERISNAEKDKAKAAEKVDVKTEVKSEIEVTPVVTTPPVKKEAKVSHKKKKKSSSKRKSRSCSAVVKSEPQSQDESSNIVSSCPLTPVSAPVDVSNTPPSFKFLKTKKHLMNEWLNEKSQDDALQPPPPPPVQSSKIEPLEIQVEDTMYVACRPSPRNALDHMRRNSYSSSCSPFNTNPKQVPENNSIGSAKKRWLRQAMWDRPIPGSQPRPMSPLGAIGAGSPNPQVGLPSPGGSPPADYITPLKKRRLASYRESIDQPATSTPAPPQDSVTLAPEDQSDEIIDVQNTEPVSSEGEMGSSKTATEEKSTEPVNEPPHSLRSSVESASSDSYQRMNSDSRISDIEASADEGEKVTSNLDFSNVTSNLNSVMASSNECDSRQEVDTIDHNICDNSSSKLETMEVDSTQNDSCPEVLSKKQTVCDSTCKVEDNRACSSSELVAMAESSLVDSSSDYNAREQQVEIVDTNADSVEDNTMEVSVPLENVGSSSDSTVLNHSFDVSSSSESRQQLVESSQVIENVTSTEQTLNSFSATSNLEGGMADSSMSEPKIDLSDMGVADVSEDSTHYVNNISATDSVGEPVASSSMGEDSGVSSEPSTPQEQPTKKKVSLLEYRKRLKEKTVVTASTPSSSRSSSSTVTTPSSTTSPIHRHHRFSTLPSLPLFDSSPTKENTSRYQFKSSSDLIRRKSAETKREKRPQLSLSERLRMEFGLDDSEEEKDLNKDAKYSRRQTMSSSSSSHIPPPPPPPPPSKQEPASAPVSSTAQPPVFQQPVFPQTPVMMRGPSPGLTPPGPPVIQQPNGAPGPTVMTNLNGASGPIGPIPVIPPNGGTIPRGPSPVMLPNGNPGILPLSSNTNSGGKPIPSLLSIKTFPTRNLPNGNEPSTTPPSSGLDQQKMYPKNQGIPANQHFVGNHHNKSPVGFTPPSADQFQPASQTPPMFNQIANGTNQPASQQNFNGTNMPPNGPVIHDYNHGYNNTDQPVQKHFHSQDQRKKSKKFKRKHYSSYQDSGGGHFH